MGGGTGLPPEHIVDKKLRELGIGESVRNNMNYTEKIACYIANDK